MIVPVILCGGSGTRLWPASREAMPKQLLRLAGSRSLLQETLRRLEGLATECAPPLVICNEAHRFQVGEQLRDIAPDAAILLEPCGRNTAPAVAVAAALAEARYQDEHPLLLVLPADHVIRDVRAFAAAVREAVVAANTGGLVTFGVVPDHANTGYGYIKARLSDTEAVPVAAFVEKPDAATAKRYIASGEYFWNSGMFLFPLEVLLGEFERLAPEILAASRRAVERSDHGDFMRLDSDAFSICPSDSIDYALMEKTDRAMMVPLDAGWSDVGSWPALHDVADKDDAGNALLGDIIAEDCRDSYIWASSRLVAAVGLDGYVVIETPDSVMVLPKDRAQDVKRIVDRLQREGRSET